MSVSSSSGTGSSMDDSEHEHHNEKLSILQPLGYSMAQCGYCAEEKGRRSVRKTGRSYGCWAHTLSCKTYKDLIDQGWRRSGKYLYKPDMQATCCPQYTISLDADSFTPSKSQRQLLRRFSTFMIEGGRENTPGWGVIAPPKPAGDEHAMEQDTAALGAPPLPSTASAGGTTASTSAPTSVTPSDSLLTTAISVTFNPAAQPSIETDDDDNNPSSSSASKSKSKMRKQKGSKPSLSSVPELSSGNGGGGGSAAEARKSKKGKGKASAHVPDLVELAHEGDWDKSDPANSFKHRFECIIEEASFTEEKYALFKQYQTQIHGEADAKVTPKGFRRFLVDTPLEIEPTGHPSYNYGSHHAKYLLDGELIAFAVLDILPTAVSSVYFVWSPRYSAMGLGKVSALRETALVREMRKEGLEDMQRYMMGFYIHSCPKMRYKAEYQPSCLLDPKTNVFYPWDHCKPLLDASDHASFSDPSPNHARAAPSPAPSDYTMGSASSASGDENEDDADDEDDSVPWPSPPPPGFLDVRALPKPLLVETAVLEGRNIVPLLFSSAWHNPNSARDISQCLAALGERTSGRVVLWVP